MKEEDEEGKIERRGLKKERGGWRGEKAYLGSL